MNASQDNKWLEKQLRAGKAVRWTGEGLPSQKGGWPEGVYVTVEDEHVIFHGNPTGCNDYSKRRQKLTSWLNRRREDCLWELVNLDPMDDFIDIITN